MTDSTIQPGQTWRDKFGESRTVLRIDRLPNYSAPGKFRQRVVFCVADQVETTCRRKNFVKWIRLGDAVVVESEASK